MGRNETTMDDNEQKMNDLLDAAALVRRWLPKTMSALLGHAHAAAKTWAASSSETEATPEPPPGPTLAVQDQPQEGE